MPIVRSPLFDEIRKAMQNLDFRVRKNKKIEMSKIRIPSNPNTEAQQKVRQEYGSLVEQWRGLTEEEKATYDLDAEPLHLSGWNLFLSDNWSIAMGLDLIKETIVVGDVTYIDIDGLDINTHKVYWIILTIKNATTQAGNLYLTVADINALTSYYAQCLNVTAGSMYANRYNFPPVGFLSVSGACTSVIELRRDFDGRMNAFARYSLYEVSNIQLNINVLKGNDIVSNITKIRLTAEKTGSLKAGSKITIFGYKA